MPIQSTSERKISLANGYILKLWVAPPNRNLAESPPVILLGSSENGRDPRLRKHSAPEAGRLLKEPREHCFLKESFQKHSNNMAYQKYIALQWFQFALSNNNIQILIFSTFNSIEDCAKDGGEEFLTEMHCAQITNL